MSTPLLDVRDVVKDFGGLRAVNHVTLQVHPGQIYGIIGPNGAGKSSLFNVLAGYFPPTSGEVYFDGQRISGLPSHEVCRLGLARTFQVVKPMAGLSVLKNVAAGALLRSASVKEATGKAQRYVEMVGLAESSAALAGSLTIGGRKRLELARALATEPRLILLDEVCGGLIPREVEALMAVIRDVRESGVTVLMIEHVMRAVMGLCDRVMVLCYGEPIAEGTPQEVTSDAKVIEAYMGRGSHA